MPEITLTAVRELLATDADTILLAASTAARDEPAAVQAQVEAALKDHLRGRKVVVILTQPQPTTIQEKLEEERLRSKRR